LIGGPDGAVPIGTAFGALLIGAGLI